MKFYLIYCILGCAKLKFGGNLCPSDNNKASVMKFTPVSFLKCQPAGGALVLRTAPEFHSPVTGVSPVGIFKDLGVNSVGSGRKGQFNLGVSFW